MSLRQIPKWKTTKEVDDDEEDEKQPKKEAVKRRKRSIRTIKKPSCDKRKKKPTKRTRS